MTGTVEQREERYEITLQGSQTLILDRGGEAWRVATGAIAVFAVELQEGRARGRRRHLFDVLAGEILIGITPPREAAHALVAVPVQPAVLITLAVGELTGDSAGRAALETWQARLHSVGRNFFEAVADLDRRSHAEARARLEEQRRLNGRLAAGTLVDLAGTAGEARAGRSPLLSALHAIGDMQGIAFRPPTADLDSFKDPVQAVALASGIRTRCVLLAGKWWKDENGPLLAYTASTRRPIALLPSRRGQYEFLDPSDDSRQPVDSTVAAGLDPVAYSFYRSFGEKRGAWDLVRFALQGYRGDVRILLLCAVTVTLFSMVIPQATALLFAHAIPDADRGLLFQIALAMIAAVIGSSLFDLTRAVSAMRIQNALGIVLGAGVWDWLLKLSPAFFRNFSAGELRARVEGFARIQEQLQPGTQRALSVGLSAILYLGLMFYYSPFLGLLAALCGFVVLSATALCSRSLSRLQDSLQQMEGSLSGLTVQLLNAVSKLRIAGAEQRAFACWAKLYGRKQRLVERVQLVRDRLRVINISMPTLAVALSFALALQGRTLDLATFLAFSITLGMFMQALTDLSDTAGGLVSIATHWRRTKTILDAPPEVDSAKGNPGRLTGRLSLDHVTFRYRRDGRLTLEDVTIHAEPGECIALVGPSGSGKSTILNLLLGFETPSSGAVLLDGQDLSGLDLAAVRRQIGVVRQDSRLMSQSIFENIVCGSRYTMDDAWEAARAAGLADDIQQMPMGMHTIVSEGGANLSGGQRQRLLIARALIVRPKILLFDEATSALDNRTQRIVTESVERLRATRIVVAHRLSTIRHADRIYVIQAGRIVQQGAFDALSAQPGLFAELMKRQMA